MIADDLGLHTGAYGDKQARTPQLDKLASEGVRFEHAFCTTASCSASRSVILSGMHNHATGHYGHAHSVHHFSYLPFVKPMPRVLRDAGYATGIIGKLHVNPLSEFPWDLKAEGENRNVWGMAEKARAFLKSNGGKPFYLHVGFGDPHRAAQGFANRDYPNVKRSVFDPAKIDPPSFLPNNQPTREEVAEYYEAANRMDQGVGFFLDALREAGQLDNTLIVFMSDNGMPFPNAKTNVYDAGSRLPLIVKAPGRKPGVSNALASWVDIMPTCLDFAQVKAPDYPMHGRSLMPVLGQENPTGWDEAYFSHTFHEITMYYPVRGVRNRRYRYLRNLASGIEYPHASDLFRSKTWQSLLPGGDKAMLGQRRVGDYLHRPEEELYDVVSDPNEVKNLAKVPQHRTTLAELRKKVHDWRAKTKDPWVINDYYKGVYPGFEPE